VTKLLVTGGAGFVGANLAIGLAERHPGWEVVALDNLHRRGSELNLTRLRDAGVAFVHGDVRERADLDAVGEIGALIECSAEPSVLAGLGGDLEYLVHTNLVGAFNCLDLARTHGAQLVFLSTSRVYPLKALRSIGLEEAETRFELAAAQELEGVSLDGISERLPLDGARTPYGATKLAAELLIAEYVDAFGLRAVVDRCGVLAGPWQMGKVDQGVFTHWVLSHYFDLPLSYIGFGGTGKQVRDLLHVDDLLELIDEQLAAPDEWAGEVVNVGGGRACSLSLLETTALCRELTNHDLPITASEAEREGDVPVFIADCSRLHARTAWRPTRGPRETLGDIVDWVEQHEGAIATALDLRATR
jgi:CDP-paratose 2-epimerase